MINKVKTEVSFPRLFHHAGLLIIALAWSCANPVAPTGGPRDEIPPEVIMSSPENKSVRFVDNQIHLDFNEYVQLKNTREQVIISPPLEEEPEYNLKGKSVLIRLNETLRENTTYTFFFGDAITDITENNPLRNFWYVFSTGDMLDSLSLKGIVRNAFNLELEENVFVMLYDMTGDSVPFTQRPYYVARTDKQGSFHFHNLRDLEYKIFAIKELNNDYLYNAPGEQIAFLDTLVRPVYIRESKTLDLTDTTAADTTTAPHLVVGPGYVLHLFQETDSTQGLIENKLLSEGLVRLAFRRPLRAPKISLLDTTLNRPWYLPEWNDAQDTLLMWLFRDIPDTLRVEVSDQKYIIDTIRLSSHPVLRGLKSKKDELGERLKHTANIRMGKLNPFDSLVLTFASPVVEYDLSGAVLISAEDTLVPSFIFQDSLQRQLIMTDPLMERTSYKVIIPDSAFFSMTGLMNDSITLQFGIKAWDEYSQVVMNLHFPDPSQQYIIQLIKEDETLVSQQTITGMAQEKVKFPNLNPGKYRIKVIIDENRNNQWDTGDYIRHRLPERVLYFEKTLEIRANWVSEETWEL